MTTSSLHIQTVGQGPDLVLLHGWAMNSGYFEPVVETLARNFRVHLVDIPGHGKNREYPQLYSVENLAKEILNTVAPVLNAKAIWLGWSLGGCIATWLAKHCSEKVMALILVASNPRFVQEANWSYGIEDKVLQDFSTSLMNEFEKTLLRFLSLQIRGAKNERELLRQLRKQMQQSVAPDNEVLKGGLEVLRNFDGRDLLSQLNMPVLMMAGEKDTLVPVKAIEHAAELSDVVQLSVWRATGHAPFLSDPERFTNEIKTFADELIA